MKCKTCNQEIDETEIYTDWYYCENCKKDYPMKKFKLVQIALLCLLTSCTYSVTLVHTEGTASDVVDETQRTDPSTTADLNIPVKPF